MISWKMSDIFRTHPARFQVQVHPGLKVEEDEYSKAEEHKFLHEAGKLASSVRDKIAAKVKPGANVLDLCLEADELIYSNNAIPAFPINISINDVAAHNTGDLRDSLTIPDRGVVKIDCGVSINGYIADTAKSIDLDGSYGDLVKATIDATEAAIKFIRDGTNLGSLGGIIEKTIRDAGFNPVRDLRGHLVERYIVHAGKSVPNIHIKTNEIAKFGEVYAIEPFASTGNGEIHADLNRINIFRAAPVRVPLRSKYAKQINRIAVKEFGGMPFAARWLERFGMKYSEIKVGLREIRKSGGIIEYHVLRGSKEDMISQHEHTMIIKKDGAEVTTR